VAVFSLPKFDKIFISRNNRGYYIISSWLKKTTESFRNFFKGKFHYLLSFEVGVSCEFCFFKVLTLRKKVVAN
jgi:hypothetical protein